jgi:hypothetical protein
VTIVCERCEQVVDEVCAGICASCHFDRTELSGLNGEANHSLSFKKATANTANTTTRTRVRTRTRDEAHDEGYLSTRGVPSPNCGREDLKGDRLLEAMFEAGDLAPVGVPFPTLPKYAGPNQRAIAAHMQLRMGLRLAVGNEKPLIYAASEAVLYGHAPNKSAAWHAIKGLEEMGVIEHVETLPGRGGRRGTKCYGPGPF